MADEKKQNKLEQTAAEETLEQVSGGIYKPAVEIDVVVRRDSKGRPTHWRSRSGADYGKVYYYVCPHCGRLLHEGFFGRLFCDPCDESWFGISLSQEMRYE